MEMNGTIRSSLFYFGLDMLRASGELISQVLLIHPSPTRVNESSKVVRDVLLADCFKFG